MFRLRSGTDCGFPTMLKVTQGFIRTAQESMARINTCNKNNSLEIWLGSELKIQQKFKEHDKWIWYNLLDFD